MTRSTAPGSCLAPGGIRPPAAAPPASGSPRLRHRPCSGPAGPRGAGDQNVLQGHQPNREPLREALTARSAVHRTRRRRPAGRPPAARTLCRSRATRTGTRGCLRLDGDYEHRPSSSASPADWGHDPMLDALELQKQSARALTDALSLERLAITRSTVTGLVDRHPAATPDLPEHPDYPRILAAFNQATGLLRARTSANVWVTNCCRRTSRAPAPAETPGQSRGSRRSRHRQLRQQAIADRALQRPRSSLKQKRTSPDEPPTEGRPGSTSVAASQEPTVARCTSWSGPSVSTGS